ncbi:multifunctional CCA addition/repair protein [Thalassotalea euphylliae]|uniref:Multifunctional CCA protein n=1 Tax=Thalassotalea euphylliae TaxID=1655234 RepID=A0A3E0UIS4_9GAMM|nr:multifunctional CCA addition/repair protein [Thalassotalea euphylliae]REL36494.1 multifunctional CCA addition/repair protein [Thalassotalea euphylliae]
MVTKLADLEVYLVGGAVRDQLLGRKVVEHDYMVVGASQQQMLNLGFQQVGKDFPVFLHPETKDEYALARTERKQGQGYTGFVCYAEPDVTLEQDLIRRDLTVNAMAQAPNGDIIDPYHGQQDLDNRILRHVSPAFSEDPLRVLRVARFAARYHQYGFTIADDTLALMTNIAVSGELKALSAERVWKEVDRALAEPNPEVFIETLRACGALKALWPELDKLWGIPNPAEHHPEICSGEHTMLVLKQAVKLSVDPKVRFASLCHDLGKGLTPEAKWPKHHGHELAGVKVIEQVAARLKVPNDYKLLAAKVSQFHLNVHRAFELKPSTVLKLLEQCEYQRKPELLANILLVCRADSLGRLGAEHNDYPQADYIAELANVSKQVTAKPFVEQGLQGKAIKEAMTAAKINAVAEKKAELLAKLS